MSKTYKISATSPEDLQKKVTAAIKAHVKQYGMKLPFGNMTYSNDKIDDWFRLSKDGKVYKLDRKTKQMKEVKEAVI